MMMYAVLSNPNHPKYGVATIPFPIPRDQYTYCMDLLEALEVGDTVKADCKVVEFDSVYTVLKRMKALTVNVEELNYLVKRLESFDTGEAAQFQAMAHKLELFELKDLINLTFCCQQATVITDFSDLAAVGRDHYMNLHGGSAKTEELDALDGKGTARQLIENGGGTITPYGVVYDNGMKLEQVYDGRFFPCYYYKPNVITVAVIRSISHGCSSPWCRRRSTALSFAGASQIPPMSACGWRTASSPTRWMSCWIWSTKLSLTSTNWQRQRMGYQKRIWKSWAPWSCWQSQSLRHRSKTLRKALTSLTSLPVRIRRRNTAST